jgi:hypothetical protein
VSGVFHSYDAVLGLRDLSIGRDGNEYGKLNREHRDKDLRMGSRV